MSDTRLWVDVPKEQKSEFLRSGRAWETGAVAKSIVEELASVYDELAEAKISARTNDIINRICGELPDGVQIVLRLENGAGYIEVEDEIGVRSGVALDGESDNVIAEALERTLELVKDGLK